MACSILPVARLQKLVMGGRSKSSRNFDLTKISDEIICLNMAAYEEIIFKTLLLQL